MSDNVIKIKHRDDTRIGEYAAQQPVSGVKLVNDTCAVNGLGRGGFVRIEEANKKRA